MTRLIGFGFLRNAVLTVRLDSEVKLKAKASLEKLGVTPSAAVQQLFDYIVRTGNLPFDDDTKPSQDEIKRRLQAVSRFELSQPLDISDDEIRAARIKVKYDIDA
ncbi:MAG: type II toxin-antitoxin system RelB/DinJ family antitoxin [Coriobacteriia bacterium]|nr:type II toxin-antitoxin system RelB/DinJ family antitoxin [Coriobacteriia bacterium]